ncbi:MAG: DEAD/DEAH box helicase [Acidobacteria bacterium]|nr:MAG: DEAD/DEAH box helicase [Acidobacteriota bacterium]
MTFSDFNLDSRLLPAIREAGYRAPTPIQSATIPPALAGGDLIGTAQTGTGKTAAFVLPILNRLLQGPRGRVRALVITPTRELAIQIDEVIKAFSFGTPLRSATVFGGVNASPQLKAFRQGVEILVACPGRLLDHLGERRVDLSGTEILVLDEADRMLDMGFLPSVSKILRYLPASRQTLLFAATFPEEIERLAAETMRQPQRIAVGISRPAQTVAHAIFPVAPHLKTALLLDLLETTDPGSVLVFTRTKHRAHRVARQVGQAGYNVTSLHGDRTQGQREAALRGFRSGEYRIMVATDIAARGLDVEGISHVINYDMPDTVDAYIHRIGRTGRATRTGDAFTLVTPEDGPSVKAIERVLGARLERATVRGFDYETPKPVSNGRPVNAGRRTPRGPGRKASRVSSTGRGARACRAEAV